MVSGVRLLFLLVIVVSVFCLVTSKHGHKKSHGPLRPGASKTGHGKGHIPKHHHVKKTHVHHHLRFKHHPKHKHERTSHLKAHSKHHHHHHQPALHLKAHKKGITFAKAPAEPQACIDFLPCLQYRYYHCRSHEWIRNNCPKLCLYCEHQPFPEPTYGRFKTVAASYPDWCLDHSQCVAYPTEACEHDEWMRLNCLRKCDTCYKDKKVKAGLVFIGTPFDQTLEQKQEEHLLNKILQFRPPQPPPGKAKDGKLKAKGQLAADVDKATAQGPVMATIEDTPIPASKPANENTNPLQASPPAANVPVKPALPEKPALPLTPNSPVVQQQNLAAGKLETKPEPQPQVVSPHVVSLRPKVESALPEKSGLPLAPNSPVVEQQNLAAGKLETKPEPQPEVVSPHVVSLRPKVEPALPEKPGLPLAPNSPVVQQQDLAAGKMETKPEAQPAVVSPHVVSLRPKVEPALPEKPGLPLAPNSPVVKQQNLAAGKLETKPQPAVVSPPAVSLRPKVKTPVGVPGYSYHDFINEELQAARDAPSTKQFKADVYKQVQIKLKTSGFPQINTAKVFVKHKVSKPERKHVVESLSAPKHKVSKPKKAHLKHKIAHANTRKHVQKKEEVAAKKEELHKTKNAKKKHVKVVKKEKKVEKKIKSHHKRH